MTVIRRNACMVLLLVFLIQCFAQTTPAATQENVDENLALLISIPIVVVVLVICLIVGISYWQISKQERYRRYRERYDQESERMRNHSAMQYTQGQHSRETRSPESKRTRDQEPRPKQTSYGREQEPQRQNDQFFFAFNLNEGKQMENTHHGASQTNSSFMNDITNDVTVALTPQWWEIPARKLRLLPDQVLGSGLHGIVILGHVTLKNNEEVKCAIKTLKGGAGLVEKKSLRKELENMSGMDHHPNVVNLIGAQTIHDNLFVVVEYCVNGSLYDYLKKNHNNEPAFGKSCVNIKYSERLRIAFDIANGMNYLATKKFVHRDLAARNVLLDDKLRAKISDFGRTRDTEKMFLKGYESVKMKNEPIPTRWMPVETLLHQVFTSQSDVWSYGVLLWEIETGGERPYNNQNTYMDVFQKVVYENYKLRKPSGCPSVLYRIMTECWKTNPEERPTFSEIANILGTLLKGVITTPPTSPTGFDHFAYP